MSSEEVGRARTRCVADRTGVEAWTEGELKKDENPLTSMEDDRPCEGVGASAPEVLARGSDRGVVLVEEGGGVVE